MRVVTFIAWLVVNYDLGLCFCVGQESASEIPICSCKWAYPWF